MPLTAQTTIFNYTGNGSTTVFAFTCKILVSTDMKVYKDGVLQASGYTVSGVGVDGGGSVTFSVAPANGVIVRLQRVVAIDRTTDYTEGGQLAASTLDNDFDRIVMQVQNLDALLIKEASDGAYDATSKRIKNVADPTGAQDAATKNYVDTGVTSQVVAAAASATAAHVSELAAAASAATATAQAVIATTQAGIATTQASNAAASAAAIASGSQTVTNLVATGGSINNTTIGATTPSTGAFTTLTTTGDVGIGPTAPAQRLHLSNAGAVGVNMRASNSANTSGVDYGLDSGGHAYVWNNASAGASHVYVGNSNANNTGSIIFYAKGVQRGQIQQDGTTTLGGTSAAPALKAIPAASQVNYLSVQASATGGSPIFSASGSDTDIGVVHSVKGAGVYSFYTSNGGAKQVEISHTASANRFLTLTGSNGGNPTISTSAGNLAITPDTYHAGMVGFGIAPNATIRLYSAMNATTVAATEFASYFSVGAAVACGTYGKIGVAGLSQTLTGYTGTGTFVGVQGQYNNVNAGLTISSGTGVNGIASSAATGTISNLIGVQGTLSNSGGATVSNGLCFYAPNHSVGTLAAGFYTDMASGAGKWAFYGASTAASYLGGTLSVSGVTYLGSGNTDYLSVAGATGAASVVAAGGSANVQLTLSAKGTSGVALVTGGGTQALVINTASANRYITLTGSNGGNPTIGVSAGNIGFSANLAGNYNVQAFNNTATPAGGAANTGFFLGSAAVGIYFGSGAPTVSAAQGSIYLQSNGSNTNERLYVNTTGSTVWAPVATGNTPSILAQAGVPVAIVPNGTVATNGTITLGTALGATYASGLWIRLPAGAVSGGSAGLYYAVMSSTTVGQVYTNFIADGAGTVPYIPSGPVNAVGSNSAYTQSGAEITLINITVPANSMGANGQLRLNYEYSYPNNANNKTFKMYFGGSLLVTRNRTTSIHDNVTDRVRNRGAVNRQSYMSSSESSSSTTTPFTYTSIDTSANVTIALTGQLGVVTDYAVFDSISFEVLPSA